MLAAPPVLLYVSSCDSGRLKSSGKLQISASSAQQHYRLNPVCLLLQLLFQFSFLGIRGIQNDLVNLADFIAWID